MDEQKRRGDLMIFQPFCYGKTAFRTYHHVIDGRCEWCGGRPTADAITIRPAPAARRKAEP